MLVRVCVCVYRLEVGYAYDCRLLFAAVQVCRRKSTILVRAAAVLEGAGLWTMNGIRNYEKYFSSKLHHPDFYNRNNCERRK